MVRNSGNSTGVDTIDSETLFQTNLCTQFFTAVLILLLQEEGLLTVDDEIHHYIDSIPFVDNSITIRQLLNHSSGLELLVDFPELEQLTSPENADKVWHIDSLIDQYIKPPVNNPGLGFYFSDLNYLLLGKIIEEVTENTFHLELRHRILDPLGLKNTFLAPYEDFENKLAQSKNIFTGEIYFESVNSLLSSAWTGGAIISTPTDIVAFLRSLFKGEIISASSMSMMLDTIFIPPGSFGEWQGMGLGIGFISYADIPFNGETGFLFHRTRAYYSPELDMGIATFLTELNGTDAFYRIVDVVKESLHFCVITSTTDLKVDNSLAIYPNPANERMTIDPGVEITNAWTLKIFNQVGQLILERKNLHGLYTLDAALPGSGSYIVKVVSPKESKINIGRLVFQEN